MNLSHVSSARLAPIGLIIAAFTAASSAADDLTSPASATRFANVSSQRPASAPSRSDQAASQQTIDLEDPKGHSFQLVHVPGQGWKQLTRAAADGGRVTVEKASRQSEELPRAAVPVGDVMTVFIDGPTGYTYTWSSEKGWTFVGHLKDE